MMKHNPAQNTPNDLVKQAEHLARRAHQGQRDKRGVDYMDHVLAVAAAMRGHGETHEIVALLHDAVEDCADREIVSFPIIEKLFGPGVRAAVDCMTKREGEAYEDYLHRVAAHPVARAVKLADLAHNQSRLRLLENAEDRTRLEKKYATARRFLSELSEDA